MNKYVKIMRHIIPFSRSNALVNPEHLFNKYEERVNLIRAALEKAEKSERREMIDRIHRMYDNDRSRQASIDRRAEIILLVNGAALAIFIPITRTVFLSAINDGKSVVIYCFMLMFVGIIYMGASIIIATGVHQRIMRHIIGVEELVKADGTLVSEAEYAQMLLKLIISNWKINNIWAERLEVARRLLRNGVAASFTATAVYLVFVFFQS